MKTKPNYTFLCPRCKNESTLYWINPFRTLRETKSPVQTVQVFDSEAIPAVCLDPDKEEVVTEADTSDDWYECGHCGARFATDEELGFLIRLNYISVSPANH